MKTKTTLKHRFYAFFAYYLAALVGALLHVLLQLAGREGYRFRETEIWLGPLVAIFRFFFDEPLSSAAAGDFWPFANLIVPAFGVLGGVVYWKVIR